MTTKTEHCHLNSKLTLHTHSQSSLTVHTFTLSLTQQDDEIIDCHLTFSVTPELYKRIDTEALFNLKLEIRGLLSAGDFQPSSNIQIETVLKPDLLPLLLENASNADEAAAYLLNLSQQQPELLSESTNEKSGTQKTNEPPENPKSPYSLLSTESWLALSVKQQQKSGETGYQTFWSYVNPTALSGEGLSSENLSESLTNFFKDLVSGSLSATTKELATETLEAVSNLLQELTEYPSESRSKNPTATQPIFQAIVNFFTEDDWAFTKIQGELSLNLAFEGDNGRWQCYAKAREEQKQFAFYSICPIKVPKPKRRAVGEFIARANYGMIIGNFELDFTDGEIRYKTSIDVEGDRLTSALIKQLVYANVTMMDEYLPGIKAVVEGELSPEDAIAKIEA